uniref:Uncharacterized protein n=2 Tax=Meloidogyne enterolobii TaxID=390850 RepID=A0A6V7WM43_MELEN|nr:unnamed protein product [Meloidogyne enterolobii]
MSNIRRRSSLVARRLSSCITHSRESSSGRSSPLPPKRFHLSRRQSTRRLSCQLVSTAVHSVLLSGIGWNAARTFRRSFNDLALLSTNGANKQQDNGCAVRQRTDASLPSDEIERNEPSPAGYGSKAAAMRRTSSMPSIVESEQHLLMLAHQRQQRQHQLFHHSSGNCCLRRGFRASTIRHYNYEDRFTKLHKRALRFTWQRLLTRNGGKRIETVFEEVFERMMHKIPIMREMFNTRTFISAMSRCEIASPRDHARLIVKMFEAAIKNLDVEQNKRTDTDSGFDPKLLGQAHGYLRPYGFTSALWEAFGEAVIDIVVNQEAVRDLPGASQAWVVLTACLVDQLRAGFDSSSRECPFKHQQSKQRGRG